jgi:PAS domain S-box-containing protein
MLSQFSDASMTVRRMREQHQEPRYARNLIEVNLDALVAVDEGGRITDVNAAMVKITGVAREELAGTNFADYFTQPNLAREFCARVFARGFVTNYPLTFRHPDGGVTDVVYNAAVFKDADDHVLGLWAAGRDVTETRTAELRFRTFIESAPDAMVLASRDGIILLVNGQTERLFGYQREELLGSPVEVLVPVRYRDAHPGHRSKFFQDPLLRPMGMGLDLWGLRKDGTEFPIEISLSPIESPQGLTVGATIRDVSVQRAASQYARSLLEASLDPLVTISPEGKITDVNEATVKVTGVAREKLIGTDFSDYFTEPDRAREGYLQVFAKGSVTDYPLTIRHKNHVLTEVLYNASVYRDLHGRVLGVFAGARDITSQRKAEAEIAEQRNKELERLAELERFQKLTVGRELKMIELKKEIQELKAKLAKSGLE